MKNIIIQISFLINLIDLNVFMKKLKFGDTNTGLILGGILVALGALVMLIGFWRVLILVCLFGVGFFIGTVDNKEDFFKQQIRKVIPDKSAQPINLKEEIAREQEQAQIPQKMVFNFDEEKTEDQSEE